jgi:hypothetical protein
MLQGAEVVGAAKDSAGKPALTSFTLHGHEQEMAKHVGHHVQVSGTLMPPLAAKLPVPGAKSAEGIRGVQVTSIEMLAASCTASGTGSPGL